MSKQQPTVALRTSSRVPKTPLKFADAIIDSKLPSKGADEARGGVQKSQPKDPLEASPTTAAKPAKSPKPLVVQKNFKSPPKQLKIVAKTPQKVQIKQEKLELADAPVIVESVQPLSAVVKEEREENFEVALPVADDEDFGEIEVLDEYYDEVMSVSPPKPPPPAVKEEKEAREGRMSLRGVKINLDEILGKKARKPLAKSEKSRRADALKRLRIDQSLIESLPKIDASRVKIEPAPALADTPNCFQPDRPYRCKKCPLSFRNRRDFGMHRKIHKKADHWCDKCGQKFRFQSSYFNHECDFWCHVCGKSISNKANLKIHLNYVHNIGSAKIFTCDLCGRFYKSKRNIDTHMKNHMAVTPFNCAICGKGFSHAGALKIHMWNHRDVVDCQYCRKKFKPRSLYYHVKKCPRNWELFGGAPPTPSASFPSFGKVEGERDVKLELEESKPVRTGAGMQTIVVIKMKK